MARQDEAQRKAHDSCADMTGGKAGRCRLRRVVDQPEDGREEKQRVDVVDDPDEKHEDDAAKDVDPAEQEGPAHPIREPAGQDHARQVDRRKHAVGGSRGQGCKSAKRRVGQEMSLDHTGGRVAAQHVAPQQNMEGRPLHDEGDVLAQRRPRRRRSEGTGRRAAAARDQPPDSRGHGQAGEAEKHEGPAPARSGQPKGDQGEDDELSAGRAGGGNAHRQALVALEALLHRRRDDMRRNQPEADGGDDGESDQEHQRAGGRRDHEAAGGHRGKPGRQHIARPLAIDQPAADRRDAGDDDERQRGGAGDEAARPAKLADPGGHHERERRARRIGERQGQKARCRDEPGAKPAGPHPTIAGHRRSFPFDRHGPTGD